MKNPAAAILIFGAVYFSAVFGQGNFPIQAGPFIRFLPPAIDANGRTLVFGSTVTPEGKPQDSIDIYVGSKRYAAVIAEIGVTADGSSAIFTDISGGQEGVGTVDTTTGAVRRIASDNKGCIRPLAICAGCIYSCVVTPHATSDGKKVLYAARRNQPFYLVNADGSGSTQLPVYSGNLAPASQRVISNNGLIVFTSSAPFGPTFAASATDVYVMNLDGTNIRNLTKYGLDTSIYASNATIGADGGTIVFELNRSSSGSGLGSSTPTQIWAVQLIQSDGSAIRQLSSSPDSADSPSISADGRTVVFMQAGNIVVVDPQAGLKNKITPLRFGAPQSPVISGDGLRVAFLAGPLGGGAGAVYQVNTDGSGLRAVYAPRTIAPRGVVSAAGFADPPSPGGLFSIYGINFTDDAIAAATGFPLPASLGGVSVRANGSALPMLSVSPWQINAQLPQEVVPRSIQFDVGFSDGLFTPAESQMASSSAPALFAIPTGNQAAAFHAGTGVLADDAHPAQEGEVLEMYGTGFGMTNPSVPAGRPSPTSPTAQSIATPGVTIGGILARVLFSGLTPGFAGLYQINIAIPPGLNSGRNAVVFRGSSGFTTITIR